MRRGSGGATSRAAAAFVAAATIAAALALSTSPGWGQGIPIAPGQQGRLRADRVRYDARAQILYAEGHVFLTLGSLELRADRLQFEQKTLVATADGAVTVRQPDFSLDAQRVRYDIRRRRAQADGAVVLVQRDVTVRAATLTMNLEAQTLTAGGGVTASQGTSTLTGRTLQADLKAKRAEVRGEAQLVRPAASVAAGPPTSPRGRMANGPAALAPAVQEEIHIRAAHLVLRWDTNEAEGDGGVVIRQENITARAQRARYAEAAGRLELQGKVSVEQFGDQHASGATLTCDRLLVLLRERDLEAAGRVTVSQKGRTATGDRGAYRETTKRIVLTGHAQLQDEEGNLIRADAVTIDLEAETFEASGNVETIFRVKRGK